MNRKLFVNLAVRDLHRSMEFFSKLGFEFDPEDVDASKLKVRPFDGRSL